jgi:hypothetical protein
MMLLLGWWFRRAPGLASLAVLLSGALLLTPAYPRDGVETFAPALVVAAFQWVNEGREAAMHALKPLAAASVAAVVLALLLRLTLFRGRRRAVDEEQAAPDPAG